MRAPLPGLVVAAAVFLLVGCPKRAPVTAVRLEPRSIRLLGAAAERETGQFPGTRADVEVESRSGERTPKVVATAETAPLELQGARARLFGDEGASAGWGVDNFVLLEFLGEGDEVLGRVVIGSTDPVVIGREQIDNLGPRSFQFDPGEVDLTSRLPESGRFRIRATALDTSGVGRVSDLFLRVEPREGGGEDDLRGQ